MARRDANLAGLAALGALGYQLYNRNKSQGGAPVEDRSTLADLRDQEDLDTGRAMMAMPRSVGKAGPSDEDVSQAMNAGYMGGGMKVNPETGELYSTTLTPSKPAVAGRKKVAPGMMSREDEAKIRATGGSRGTRYAPVSSSAQADYEAAQAKAASPEGRAERKRLEEAQAIENMTGDFLPIGRLGKMVGGAAKSARTALATRAAEETPVTFMGASGRRAVGEAERLGAAQKRLRGPEGREVVKDTVDTLPPAKRALEYTVPEVGRDAVTNPMYWMSGGKAMKKGGAVKSSPAKAEKPAAKGWGKARGARGAKYY